jgi:hypothetical protein
MDAATISFSTFTLWRPDGTQVGTLTTYDPATWTATITPTVPLALSTTYTVKLEPTIADAAGVQLGAQTVTQFTTSGVPAAVRIQVGDLTDSYTAANGDVFKADTHFKSGAVRSVTNTILNTTDQELYKDDRTGVFTYTIPVSPGLYDIKFHFAELSFNAANRRKFHIDVLDTPVVNDLSNFDIWTAAGGQFRAVTRTLSDIAISDGQVSLKTVAVTDMPSISAIEVIPKAPVVTAKTPAAGATNVSRTTTVTATFNRAMDSASVGDNFQVTGSGGTQIPATLSWSGNQAILTFGQALPASTTYTVTVGTAARDTFGATLAAPVTWTFTTAP